MRRSTIGAVLVTVLCTTLLPLSGPAGAEGTKIRVERVTVDFISTGEEEPPPHRLSLKLVFPDGLIGERFDLRQDRVVVTIAGDSIISLPAGKDGAKVTREGSRWIYREKEIPKRPGGVRSLVLSTGTLDLTGRSLDLSALLKCDSNAVPMRVSIGKSTFEGNVHAVARTVAEWKALWKRHEGRGDAPEVDFKKEMVVGVFLGNRFMREAIVTEVRTNGTGVTVHYEDRKDPRHYFAKPPPWPYAFIACRKIDGKVAIKGTVK